MKDKLYQSKELRDAEAKRLQGLGFEVRRRSVRNQQLHPQYIEDAPQHLRNQTGFGNTVYTMMWSVLYEVEWEMTKERGKQTPCTERPTWTSAECPADAARVINCPICTRCDRAMEGDYLAVMYGGK